MTFHCLLWGETQWRTRRRSGGAWRWREERKRWAAKEPSRLDLLFEPRSILADRLFFLRLSFLLDRWFGHATYSPSSWISHVDCGWRMSLCDTDVDSEDGNVAAFTLCCTLGFAWVLQTVAFWQRSSWFISFRACRFVPMMLKKYSTVEKSEVDLRW